MFVESPQSLCNFGQAHGDVTPPVGIYHRMWGAASHDRSTGLHDRLRASALVFESPEAGRRQILVTLDHCLLWNREMDEFRQRVLAKTGVPSEQLLITFSHTHGAGLMGYERVDLPGGDLIPAYLQELAERVSDAVVAALSDLQPCCIQYVAARCSLAANRDFWDAEREQYVCGYNPAGQADDVAIVARVTGPNKETKAVIVNYACHPTTLAWQNTLISPDYVQACRGLVESALGGDARCTFLQGASGDLGPKVGFVGDVEQAERNGRQLGYAVVSALEGCPPPGTRFEYQGPVISGATIGVWKHVPIDDAELAAKRVWEQRRWTVDLELQPGLPTAEQCLAEREQWENRRRQALEANDAQQAADARAMVERLTRKLHRVEQLPKGDRFPYPVSLWRIGDAVWIAVEGEPYQDLQIELRRRFPQWAIVVLGLGDGSRCGYLPRRDVYGKGVYQESASMLAPGCLERVIESIAGVLGELN
jgi:hypothetical protein